MQLRLKMFPKNVTVDLNLPASLSHFFSDSLSIFIFFLIFRLLCNSIYFKQYFINTQQKTSDVQFFCLSIDFLCRIACCSISLHILSLSVCLSLLCSRSIRLSLSRIIYTGLMLAEYNSISFRIINYFALSVSPTHIDLF